MCVAIGLFIECLFAEVHLAAELLADRQFRRQSFCQTDTWPTNNHILNRNATKYSADKIYFIRPPNRDGGSGKTDLTSSDIRWTRGADVLPTAVWVGMEGRVDVQTGQV